MKKSTDITAEEFERLNVNFKTPAERALLQKLRIAAVSNRRKIRDLAILAISEYLAREAHKK